MPSPSISISAGGGGRRAHGAEIILCGGAINSPQLLQLSGIGSEDQLKRLGIPVIHHLPGVGENLQEHPEVYVPCGTALLIEKAAAPAGMAAS